MSSISAATPAPAAVISVANADTKYSQEDHSESTSPLSALARQLRRLPYLLSSFPLVTLPPIHAPTPSPISNAPTLYVHRGRWPRQKTTWASSDPDCLVWQCLLQFSGLKYDLVLCDEPLMSPTGQLPFLVSEKGRIISDRDRLLRYIATRAGAPENTARVHAEAARGARPDVRLLLPEDLGAGTNAGAQAHAYLALMDAKLWPALRFNWWIEPRNLPYVQRLYADGVYPRPIDALVFGARQSKVAAEWRQLGVNPDDVYVGAAEALEALADKLADKTFFFGDNPSVVDAVLFAALHSILSADFPADKLRGLTIAHANLYQYAKEMWNNWFRKFEMNVKPLKRCGVEVPGPRQAGAGEASTSTTAGGR
ncbi:hypothetical protein BCR44DRAFT_122777 [Catenaria anguillulae PL171]|uniref:GST C-terminal domain-containing protein n=1 Tax=Catenaria anguillulae PL171 TaxID=765915 RepID=A0A1Y2I3Y5_9FUNG|nr:hypothetical protein BCR44DRAFT_122777 [Catenaria anguillulae PL171]